MRTLLRRALTLAVALTALYSMIPCQAAAVSTSAASAILVDVDSGRVLYEYNADARMRIASTTKLLTALVALERGDLNDVVTVSREAAYTEGSSMYLKEGEELTLETLLYGLLLCSGNDAAVAIAEHIAGSQEKFAELMNEKAAELGMENSSFVTPNGLDAEDHYSTARDMARLACAAVGNEILVRMASTRTVTIAGRTMTNHNKLLGSLEGCIGLKTGYTMAAGRTLVTCAERNGQRLAAVTLQDGNDWADHQALYDYGFSAYPAEVGASVRRPDSRGLPGGGGQLRLAPGGGRDIGDGRDAGRAPDGAPPGRRTGGGTGVLSGWERGRPCGAAVRRRCAAGDGERPGGPETRAAGIERTRWKSDCRSCCPPRGCAPAGRRRTISPPGG